MRGATDAAWRIFGGIAALGEAHLLAQDAQGRVLDALRRHLAGLDQAFEIAVVDHGEGHLDVLARQRGLFRIAHAEDEIGHDEAGEAPVALRMSRQQGFGSARTIRR